MIAVDALLDGGLLVLWREAERQGRAANPAQTKVPHMPWEEVTLSQALSGERKPLITDTRRKNIPGGKKTRAKALRQEQA